MSHIYVVTGVGEVSGERTVQDYYQGTDREEADDAYRCAVSDVNEGWAERAVLRKDGAIIMDHVQWAGRNAHKR